MVYRFCSYTQKSGDVKGEATMLKSALFCCLLMAALCAPSFCDDIGHARQTPINASGIQGHIFIVDTGNSTDGLIVLGTATGLDPTLTYVSLLYDNGSVPGGPNACEPTTPFPQMFVATWTVNPDGTGSLLRRKTGTAYVALSQVRTISIRQAGVPNNLRACGEIARNPVP